MVLFELAELIRNNPWLRRRILLRTFLVRIFRASVSCATLGKGTKKMIGNSAEFFLDPAFYFSDFSTWGSKHNSGFSVAINMSKGKKTFFDVGAHIGLYSLPVAHRLGILGTVFAFEAATENIRYLASHKKRNSISNITIVPTLVGSTNENEVAFFESSGTSGMNSITEPRKRRARSRVSRPSSSWSPDRLGHGPFTTSRTRWPTACSSPATWSPSRPTSSTPNPWPIRPGA